jgi:hypothetical protein
VEITSVPRHRVMRGAEIKVQEFQISVITDTEIPPPTRGLGGYHRALGRSVTRTRTVMDTPLLKICTFLDIKHVQRVCVADATSLRDGCVCALTLFSHIKLFSKPRWVRGYCTYPASRFGLIYRKTKMAQWVQRLGYGLQA